MATITVDIADADATLIEQFLAGTKGRPDSCSHGPLDMKTLIGMLIEDVALMVRRPGSWEGANMGQVMTSHGYDPEGRAIEADGS